MQSRERHLFRQKQSCTRAQTGRQSAPSPGAEYLCAGPNQPDTIGGPWQGLGKELFQGSDTRMQKPMEKSVSNKAGKGANEYGAGNGRNTPQSLKSKAMV